MCLLLTMYCSFLFINDRLWWMYMFVYTLYKLSMSVYGYVLYESVSCVCLCLPVFVRWTCVVLYICMQTCCICLHVRMAPGKISCKLTGSPSLYKVFELNWIRFTSSARNGRKLLHFRCSCVLRQIVRVVTFYRRLLNLNSL